MLCGLRKPVRNGVVLALTVLKCGLRNRVLIPNAKQLQVGVMPGNVPRRSVQGRSIPSHKTKAVLYLVINIIHVATSLDNYWIGTKSRIVEIR